MITPEILVNREVYSCSSSLISILANGEGVIPSGRSDGATNLRDLCEQALNLCAPIDDWEEGAIQEGWCHDSNSDDGSENLYTHQTIGPYHAADWEHLCNDHDIEPYQREVFEHWIVSPWLADKLAERGERVDKDFAGLSVWARTTTGQGIASDYVIELICKAVNEAAS